MVERAPEVGDPAERWHELATEVVAHHDRRWRHDGTTVDLGDDLPGVTLRPMIEVHPQVGEQATAVFWVHIAGGPFGPRGAWASMSGYGPSPQAAAVEGACAWTCSFVPVLRAALTGAPGEPTLHEEVEIDGVRYRLVSNSLGRSSGGPGPDGRDPSLVMAERFGVAAGGRRGGSLSAVVARSGTLPTLSTSRPTLLSTFAFDFQDRTIEVKVDGADWPAAHRAFDHVPPPDGSGFALLRELAVLAPVEPTAADRLAGRQAIARTLAGASLRPPRPDALHSWPGWSVHGGRLGPPCEPAVDLGLDPDTVHLLRTVGAPGAGPGYGLLSPQRFGDVVPLAHAGSGCTWVVRLDAAHAGEVWCDATGSDQRSAPVAPSATAWFLDWLDALRRDAPA